MAEDGGAVGTIDLGHLRQWIGREERASERLTAAQVARFNATLDLDAPVPAAGDPAPPGAQWLVAMECAPARQLGHDGHRELGHFLPPAPLPRRMWAGGESVYHRDLPVEGVIDKISRVDDVQAKSGRSGALVFVTVRHEYRVDGALAIEERQDVVYREAPPPAAAGAAGAAAPPAAEPAPTDETESEAWNPDPVTLFRYSALTFNGHQIHYDRDHCRENGYRGLVVHGPLLGTTLMRLAARMAGSGRLRAFRFRALAPTIEGDGFTACGRANAPNSLTLWVRRGDGALAMRAEAEV